MYSRCNGPLPLLGTIVISIVLATTKRDIIVKKPFGPKMCDRFCNLIKEKERMNAENSINVSEGEEVFRCRGYVIMCKPSLPNPPTLTNKEDAADGRVTRLLMMPQSPSHQQQGRQLFLANNSIVTYPFLGSNVVGAIAYIPSQKKLVMSTVNPHCIVLVPVDAHKKTVLKTKYIITSIAIDDDKQLIFLKTIYPITCVCLMRSEDKKQTVLFRLKLQCKFFQTTGDLLADHKRSLVYILCTYSEILHFTYQGVPKGRVTEVEHVAHGGLYMQGDNLYYQTKRNVLVQISLFDHSHVKFATLKLPPIQTLFKFGNILYMVPFANGENILVANMSEMGTITKLKTGFAKNVKKVPMCFIP